MENNEIYIDGVNVAGCEFFDYECSAYRQEYWESEDNTKDMCSSHPNCYFKQLKRLEQENKELKKTKGRRAFKSLDNTFCDEARIKIDKLELDKDCLNASLETARKYRGIAEAERDKYRSALEEIREILIICKEFRICERCKFYKECNKDLEGCITDKINEVLTP